MLTIRPLALFVSTATVIANCPIPSSAQSSSAASQASPLSIQLSIEKSSYSVGEKPVAVLAMENKGSKTIWFSNDRYQERIHITTNNGEPPKTDLHRHLLGDYRPGDGPVLNSGPVAGRAIAPGALDSQSYDLSYFYDLRAPGNYSVFIEIYDPQGPQDRSGRWLRTNTAHFEVVTPQ